MTKIKGITMYVVTFDIDMNCLSENGISHSKVYGDIRKFMESMVFSGNRVACILVIILLMQLHV